jgi:peptide/nickel transport system substrate-binding protein
VVPYEILMIERSPVSLLHAHTSRRELLRRAGIIASLGVLSACATPTPAQPTSAPATGATLAPSKPAAAAPTTVPATAAPSAKTGPVSRLVVAQSIDLTSPDPTIAPDQPSESIYLHFADPLFKSDKNAQPQHVLGKSFRSLDATTWELTIQSGVKFHNGEAFDAEAVKFSIDWIKDPQHKSLGRERDLDSIASTQVINPTTIQVKTKEPYPILPIRLGRLIPIPPKYYQTNSAETISKAPIGTGPYRFTEWVKNERVVLDVNRDYWRAAPKIDQIVFRAMPEASSRLAALLAGEADVATNLQPDNAKQLETNKGLKLLSVPSERVMMIGINSRAGGPLADKRVRQALNYAVDKQTLITRVLAGFAEQVSTILTPQHFAYDASVKPYSYDPEQAKKLLSDGPDSPTVTASSAMWKRTRWPPQRTSRRVNRSSSRCTSSC